MILRTFPKIIKDILKPLPRKDYPVLDTFSRDTQVFQEIITKLKNELRKKKGKEKSLRLFPIDSTIITLTSKLLWSQGYHQVKLFCGLDSWTAEVGGIVINFGQGHDHKIMSP
jgi:putative transposase